MLQNNSLLVQQICLAAVNCFLRHLPRYRAHQRHPAAAAAAAAATAAAAAAAAAAEAADREKRVILRGILTKKHIFNKHKQITITQKRMGPDAAAAAAAAAASAAAAVASTAAVADLSQMQQQRQQKQQKLQGNASPYSHPFLSPTASAAAAAAAAAVLLLHCCSSCYLTNCPARNTRVPVAAAAGIGVTL